MKNKQEVFIEVEKFLTDRNIFIQSKEENKPWGGFFVIDDNSTEKFIDSFFSNLDKNLLLQGKISPKILFVEPNKKLSWQYHFRRSEIWNLIEGEAAIIRSKTNNEEQPINLIQNETIMLEREERHRLVGLNDWGVVAEIWVHTDSANPSNEDDIVRIQDDFGR
jgi:mannose-6-phosphate isomerase-like protein (cupin superfamily)